MKRFPTALRPVLPVLSLQILAVVALSGAEYLPEPQALLSHGHYLGLDDVQVAEITRLGAQAQQRFVALKAKVTQARGALQQAVMHEPMDAARIEAAGTALLDAERAIKNLVLKTRVAGNAVLDVAQRAKVIAYVQTEQQLNQRLRQIKELAAQLHDRGVSLHAFETKLEAAKARYAAGNKQQAVIQLQDLLQAMRKQLPE